MYMIIYIYLSVFKLISNISNVAQIPYCSLIFSSPNFPGPDEAGGRHAGSGGSLQRSWWCRSAGRTGATGARANYGGILDHKPY